MIGGETTNNYFGTSLASGDFNADGKIDLAVGAYGYSTSTGRTYLFYNDGSIPTIAVGADVIIIGESAANYFGYSLTSGDFNSDGRTDLVVGANQYSGSTGRAYLFYNDGSIPTTAASADVIITGETMNNYFGRFIDSGDFNADGKIDLVVGAQLYSTSTGRVYLFYSGSIITENASGADTIITGETTNNAFGTSLNSGDFNADGKTDLAVGANGYSSSIGRTYLFYNDGSIPTTAATADVIITGETTNDWFGNIFISGDFNADGKTDLAVGAYNYSSSTGRAYLFYNGSIITENASGADVIITGETTSNNFGYAMAAGDFNADGKTDLAVGAQNYSTSTGRSYLFYNGSIITENASGADVIITGETTSNNFGSSLVSGDFNSDGKVDLVVGAYNYASSRGRVYIFTSQNGQVNTNVNLTGEATSNYFGYAMTAGDFNADGKIDLAVGSYGYSTETGRVYIFYNDGSYTTAAATADVIITGETTNTQLGWRLISGDFNVDGKIDLAIGAPRYSGYTGRVYLFYNGSITTENASGADVIITGESSSIFGNALTTGDFNTDGEIDIVVGAQNYSTSTGRAYIFYADGTNNFGTVTCSGTPAACSAANADIFITGEATHYFGTALTSGDFNADGNIDLAVSTQLYSTSTGRVYIFYNDGSIPTTAATADAIISGEGGYFGVSLASGDFNADGKIDLAAAAYFYNFASGRVYLFYNGSITTENASGADVIIGGQSDSDLGDIGMVSGDFNADGKTDLALGGKALHGDTVGKAYILYNDGSYPATTASADVIITGEAAGNYFAGSLASGDFNSDGKTDLVVGAYNYSSGTGRVYLYETRDNFAWQLQSQSSLSGGLRTNPSFSGQELKVTGELNQYSSFGYSLTSGDFNADGKIDLVVGAQDYSSLAGRVYVFYNDGSVPSAAASADIIIAGEANSYFGWSLSSGDFNADSKTDLAVGATNYSTSTGRAYIFYNDDSIPTTAANADVIITGTTGSSHFGISLASGDFNADGKTDISVGADYASSGTGKSYIFYNDGSIPTTVATADVTITGEVSNDQFGHALTAGDFNADGKTDLAVGSPLYPSNVGRAYIFYNDGSIPTTAATADVIISGEGSFGDCFTSGDFNADGKTDLAVGASVYSGYLGRAYIFYNDGSIPTTAATADVIITGSVGNQSFASSLVAGDWNADGRADLASGAFDSAGSNIGKVYIFYNDGSIPTTSATADVGITGEAGSNMGSSLASGDFNADGKTDLAVGAYGYSSSRGRVYMYTFNDGVITGEGSSNFGYSLTSGDFNADGRIDLAIGATAYNVFAFTGRTYLFYNDGSIPTTAATADVIITGETTNNNFGSSLVAGDLNSDGKIDLVVGAHNYSSITGRAYIFYNDGSIPTTAATADVIITGGATSNTFGYSLISDDLNADGRADLAVGARGYSTSTGRAYIFYNDGSIPTTAATADVIITGETTSNSFGYSLTSGDFNADGKIDFVVGALGYSGDVGRAYIFYNGSIITESASGADVIITGEAASYFGSALTSGDFNADGKTDLTIGARGYSSDTGRAYIFYNDGSIPTTAASADVIITGETTSNYFGASLVSGDFNADGKTDLTAGAYLYSTSTGRTYFFYNDGSIPTTAASADVIITGETTSSYFGVSLSSGDFNADGKTDLVSGAWSYSSQNGRTYIFIIEAKVEENVQQFKSKGTFKAKGDFRVK